MAVSVDTVYQRVLVLANKEQRGYITPQEFNLLANHAQMEIFEQYFHDIKQHNRMPGNTQEYSDPLSVLYQKIGAFEVDQGEAWMTSNMTVTNDVMQIPLGLMYKIGTISVGGNQVEIVNSKDFDAARFNPLTAPTLERPIGFISVLGLKVAIAEDTYAIPIANLNMSINYIMRPSSVQWAYVVVNDKPLYNDNISEDFELHASEETELVYKILKLAGVNLKAPGIVQVGQMMEQSQIQQEKQ